MAIRIGNAPCSWGVEFADVPRNPPWQSVLAECAGAGYRGIELGPVGYMPEDPDVLGEALDRHGLELIGGVVFRPFHDPGKWHDVLDGAVRTCQALSAHGARHLVLIDSISPVRASTAGRVLEAKLMETDEWNEFRDRISHVARLGSEEYGLTVSIHAHAGGFMDFEPELVRLLDEVDESILKICFDTGHHVYSGFDPVAFMRQHIGRISYMHFKDIDPDVLARVVDQRMDFYDACGQGVFCNLGQGTVNFPAVRKILLDAGFDGWCTVEQDCDPLISQSPAADAQANRAYLASAGFELEQPQ